MERFDLRGDPTGFLFAVGRVMAQNRRAARQHGQKVFLMRFAFFAIRLLQAARISGVER